MKSKAIVIITISILVLGTIYGVLLSSQVRRIRSQIEELRSKSEEEITGEEREEGLKLNSEGDLDIGEGSIEARDLIISGEITYESEEMISNLNAEYVGGYTIEEIEELIEGGGISYVSYGVYNKIPGITIDYFSNLSGENITTLNATELLSGIVPVERIQGAYTGITGLGGVTFSGDVVLNYNELKLAALENLIDFPTGTVEGQMFWHTGNNKAYWYDETDDRWWTGGDAATVVVAASDSQNKEKADYICDGTGDQVEIQAAIDSLPSGGGKVELLEGTFHIESTIVISNEYWITVQGQGINTSLRGYLNADIFSVTGSGTGYSSGIVIFRDLVFAYNDGYKNANTALYLSDHVAHIWVTNCWFEDGQRGVETNGADYVILTNCMGEGNNDDFFINNSQYVDIISCKSWDGAASTNGSIYVNNSTDVRIIGGSYRDGAGRGIVLAGSNRCSVSEVNIYNFAREGLWLSTADNNVITNNVVWNNGTGGATPDGIRLDNSSHNVITGNRCYDVNGAGGTQRYGVLLYGTGTHNIIVDNDLTGNQTGGVMDISSDPDTKVSGNLGYATETSGTATVVSGQTSVDVTHNLATTPSAQDILISPTNNLGNATKFWISDVGATTFRINVDADPGASTATFSWDAEID